MATDLVQFITDQLDALPESTQREIIEHLAVHYHFRTYYDSYGLPRRTDIPPRIPLHA